MFKEQNQKDTHEETAAAIGSRFKRALFLWFSDVRARNVPVSDERYCIVDDTADLLIYIYIYIHDERYARVINFIETLMIYTNG